jgi:hypothetical protein
VRIIEVRVPKHISNHLYGHWLDNCIVTRSDPQPLMSQSRSASYCLWYNHLSIKQIRFPGCIGDWNRKSLMMDDAVTNAAQTNVLYAL